VQISYGLGWIIQDYKGLLLLQHGGAIDGFRSHVSLVPDNKMGIALLNNLDGNFMNLALSNALIDLLAGLPTRDWNAYFLDIQTKGEVLEKERARLLRAQRKVGTKPSLPLEAYTGKFSDAAYGTCTVVLEQGQLFWLWYYWRCPLEHYQDDIFLANGEGLVDGQAAFALDANGKVGSLKMVGRVFKRLPS